MKLVKNKKVGQSAKDKEVVGHGGRGEKMPGTGFDCGLPQDKALAYFFDLSTPWHRVGSQNHMNLYD